MMLGMGPTTGVYVILFYILAATVYGCGKTFFWPTMLGVVSERFPKGGAMTLGITGGIGMLVGRPARRPRHRLPAGFVRHSAVCNDVGPPPTTATQAEDPGTVPVLPGDPRPGQRQGGHAQRGTGLGPTSPRTSTTSRTAGRNPDDDKNLQALKNWWDDGGRTHARRRTSRRSIVARLYGGKMALTWTAVVPAMMALGYLILILYFWSRGGYQAQVLLEHKANDEEFTGGVEGPADM